MWDWDRYTANDLIGGFSIPVPEIVEWSKDGQIMKNWYRLLDGKDLKQKYEQIIEDAEAEKVSGARESQVGAWNGSRSVAGRK